MRSKIRIFFFKLKFLAWFLSIIVVFNLDKEKKVFKTKKFGMIFEHNKASSILKVQSNGNKNQHHGRTSQHHRNH